MTSDNDFKRETDYCSETCPICEKQCKVSRKKPDEDKDVCEHFIAYNSEDDCITWASRS